MLFLPIIFAKFQVLQSHYWHCCQKIVTFTSGREVQNTTLPMEGDLVILPKLKIYLSESEYHFWKFLPQT